MTLRSTAERTVVRRGDDLVTGPGEPHVARADLGGEPTELRGRGSRVLLRILHLTDLHVMDAASPARAEWVEQRADDPRWQPLLHMHRPYEALANWGTAELLGGVASWAGEPIELAVTSGDCIDNAQANELDAFLAVMDGGRFAFPYAGPLENAWRERLDAVSFTEAGGSRAPGPTPRYGAGGRDRAWTFWTPEDPSPDRWKRDFGFPHLPGLLAAISDEIRAVGIGIPWLGVLGNHDVMRQGTAWTTPALEAIATGSWKAAGPADRQYEDPVSDYLVAPHDLSSGYPRFPVVADPDRRAISAEEFIRAHAARRHGFPEGATTEQGDYVTDTAGGVRVVVLDTNHPSGNFQGSVGDSQLAWLGDRLAEAADRPCVAVTHHGGAALINTYGVARRDTADLEAVLHRHGNVVAWLSGHRHVHRVRPCPDPSGRTSGFWEITTGSLIDWPCQGRIVEIVAGPHGRVGVVTTVVDHDAGEWIGRGDRWLAALHRDLAERFSRSERVDRPGRPTDRNALLAR